MSDARHAMRVRTLQCWHGRRRRQCRSPSLRGGRARRSSCSPGCATTRATGTTTRKSRPTSSIRSSSTRPSRSIPRKSSSPPSSEELLSFPFLFMTGHKLVRFTPRGARAAAPLRRARRPAVLGRLQPRRQRAVRAQLRGGDEDDLSGARRRCRSCRSGTPIYRSFFTFDDGPPTTSHELNGWGDEIVHDYLRGLEHARPARRALQQQGLRLRVGLRLAEQALPARGQHQVRGQRRRLRDDVA